MKIESPSTLKNSANFRTSRSTSKGKGTSFASHVEGTPQEMTSRPSVSAEELQDVQDLLQLQEATRILFTLRRSKERAEQILSELDKIRLSILSGTLDRRSLLAIKDALEVTAIPSSDSQLNEIVLEIEQRLAIELAKIEMSEKEVKML